MGVCDTILSYVCDVFKDINGTREAEDCSDGYAQHSGQNYGGDHGQVDAISNEQHRNLSSQSISVCYSSRCRCRRARAEGKPKRQV